MALPCKAKRQHGLKSAWGYGIIILWDVRCWSIVLGMYCDSDLWQVTFAFSFPFCAPSQEVQLNTSQRVQAAAQVYLGCHCQLPIDAETGAQCAIDMPQRTPDRHSNIPYLVFACALCHAGAKSSHHFPQGLLQTSERKLYKPLEAK